MKKLFLTLILAILWVQAAFGYTVYYDCGECDILTSATNTSGLQAKATANSAAGWSYVTFGSGNVTFTYGGSYSDHTFTLDQDSGAAAVSSITGGMMSGGRIY